MLSFGDMRRRKRVDLYDVHVVSASAFSIQQKQLTTAAPGVSSSRLEKIEETIAITDR